MKYQMFKTFSGIGGPWPYANVTATPVIIYTIIVVVVSLIMNTAYTYIINEFHDISLTETSSEIPVVEKPNRQKFQDCLLCL